MNPKAIQQAFSNVYKLKPSSSVTHDSTTVCLLSGHGPSTFSRTKFQAGFLRELYALGINVNEFRVELSGIKTPLQRGYVLSTFIEVDDGKSDFVHSFSIIYTSLNSCLAITTL